MNTYEGMFIVNPQIPDSDIGRVVTLIQEEITKNDGKILGAEILGKQHLAYPIKKFKEGYYILLNFTGQGGLISKILPKYRINENIIRNLIIKKKAIGVNTPPKEVVSHKP